MDHALQTQSNHLNVSNTSCSDVRILSSLAPYYLCVVHGELSSVSSICLEDSPSTECGMVILSTQFYLPLSSSIHPFLGQARIILIKAGHLDHNVSLCEMPPHIIKELNHLYKIYGCSSRIASSCWMYSICCGRIIFQKA